MTRTARRAYEHYIFVVALTCAWMASNNDAAGDTAPNPLQSAYWRFEEGANFANVNSAVANPVLDSTNQNHLDAFNPNTSPVYTSTVPPTPLKSGLSNTLALDFIPHEGGGDDLFTLFSNGDLGKGPAKNINNGIIAPGGGFTLEAAFKTNNPARFAAIVSKEGRPGGSRPEQTLALKTRADNSLLQIEQWDGNGNLVQVSSLAPLDSANWYYAAVVSNGSTLSLYLNTNGGGYQLQGSVATTGALYQAVPANPSWDNSWTVGRGQFDGHPADWFDGIIDEVRLTNSALPTSQFLFAPATPILAGDYNNNGKVDAADYVLWRKGAPLANETVTIGSATPEDYTVWRGNFGSMLGIGSAVPESSAAWLCGLAMSAMAVVLRRRFKPVSAHCVAGRCVEAGKMSATRFTTPSGPIVRSLLLMLSFSLIANVVHANTDPNPLQSAYWRFEEGANFANVNAAVADPVLDSINQNHLDVFDPNTAPVYTSSVPPAPLKSGLPNALALDFIPHAGGGDDLFALFSDGDFGKGLAKSINNGIIAPNAGFTLEAAFKTNNPARYAAIVGKDAQPGGSRPVQTFVLKTRADNSRLQVELWDGNGTMKQVSSLAPLTSTNWYYAAVVNTGSTLSLYLNTNGTGYQLQGSVAVTGALFQGNPASPLWDASWTIGRGQYGGNPADWFDGIIDEVRLSNTVLATSDFLFAPAGPGGAVPEPFAGSLVALLVVALVTRRTPRTSHAANWR